MNRFKLIFLLTAAFNIIDAISTYIFVCVLKVAQEANPLMEKLLDISPVLFFMFKINIVTIGIYFLYYYGTKYQKAKIGLYVLCGVYTLVMINSAYGFTNYLIHRFGG